MKKNKFLSALLAPMLCVSGSAMANEKPVDKLSTSSNVEKTKEKSKTMDSDARTKLLIGYGSFLGGAALASTAIGLPLAVQKNNLRNQLANEQQGRKAAERSKNKAEEKEKKLEKQFEVYKKFEEYFGGNREKATTILNNLVKLLPYFISKSGDAEGKLAYNKVFDDMDIVIDDDKYDEAEPYDYLMTPTCVKSSYSHCTDDAKRRIAEYGIKAMNFFALLIYGKCGSTKVIENLSL